MTARIRIFTGNISLEGELFSTECAMAIAAVLPLEARPNEWGDELYFEIPVEKPLDHTATTEVRVGDIGYWPAGNALAIFFGPTPMSSGNEPVPASAVNLVGKITRDATLLTTAKGSSRIRIERA